MRARVCRWLRQPGVAWCGVALAMLLGSLVAMAFDAHALEWQPALARTQPWRWWTAAFVHYSTTHVVGNFTGLALTAAFGWASMVPLRAAVAWLAAWPLTHLGLVWVPGLLHYAGLSGVVHAGVAIVLAHLLITGTRGQRGVALAVLVGLIAKIATETPWGPAVQHPEGWDIGIAPMAHVTGIVSGTLCALIAQWLASRRASGADALDQ